MVYSAVSLLVLLSDEKFDRPNPLDFDDDGRQRAAPVKTGAVG